MVGDLLARLPIYQLGLAQYQPPQVTAEWHTGGGRHPHQDSFVSVVDQNDLERAKDKLF